MVWGFATSGPREGRVDASCFTKLIPKARFLFGAEIADYMNEASRKHIDLAGLLGSNRAGC